MERGPPIPPYPVTNAKHGMFMTHSGIDYSFGVYRFIHLRCLVVILWVGRRGDGLIHRYFFGHCLHGISLEGGVKGWFSLICGHI